MACSLSFKGQIQAEAWIPEGKVGKLAAFLLPEFCSRQAISLAWFFQKGVEKVGNKLYDDWNLPFISDPWNWHQPEVFRPTVPETEGPVFDNSLVTNVTAQLGGTAHLQCKVLNIRDKDNPVSETFAMHCI